MKIQLLKNLLRVDEFTLAWNKDAKALLTNVSKATKIHFSFHETKVALHLYDAFSSTSFPLLFIMRFFMHSLKGDSADSMSQLTGLILHETLHRYLDDIVKKITWSNHTIARKI